MITVLLADDHMIVRSLLQLLLERRDIQIVAVASSGREAVEKVVLYGPNVVAMDRVQATLQICTDCPETRALMASLHDTPHYIRRSVQAGALGYLLKDVAHAELVGAVRSIHNGKHYSAIGLPRLPAFLYSSSGRVPARKARTKTLLL